MGSKKITKNRQTIGRCKKNRSFLWIVVKQVLRSMNTSVGRGSAYVVIISGVLLCLTSIILLFLSSVKELEKED